MHKERGVYLKDALEHNTSLLKTTLVEQQQYKATQDMLVANQRAVIAKMQETSDRSVDQHARHPSSIPTAPQQHVNGIPAASQLHPNCTMAGSHEDDSAGMLHLHLHLHRGGEGGITRTCPCLLETTLCWTPFVCNATLTWLRAQR